ncbi:IS110 family transposase [Ideonella livida]|uniref:IS110 family transposase n=1 Tax=Ideonella livida TaxID=2707176 RepID=A0A7C9TNP6_9BURK|nr:IS110 family transposase [Ideonella livida]NDY93765.1 IS110 family transposase [Ideonella livida]
MTEISPSLVCRVGVDLAKRVYQVHCVDGFDKVVSCRSMSPDRFFEWCRTLQPGCVVAMESCSGAHHVCRRLGPLGLRMMILPAQHVGAYRSAGKRSKNDATDAAAICEAASRPHLHAVPVKTAAQQGVLAIHRLREGYKEERTALINRLRGLLAEFGLTFAQSPQALRSALPDVLEDASNELPGDLRLALQRGLAHWDQLDAEMAWCEQRIAQHARSDSRAKKAAELMGVGPITASAVVATVDDFTQFKSAKQFGGWAGLAPSQNSSGGKTKLSGITKRGDVYLRTLLIQGAKSAVMTAHQRSDPISQWLVQLKERVGWQKAVVAMANKNARILWCLMTREDRFDPHHLPQRAAPAQAATVATPAVA